MKLSVVMPAFNEQENIGLVVAELMKILPSIDGLTDYEIVVVDDHSNDATSEVVHQLGNDRARCLRLSRRSGSHTAIRAGLAYATGDAVLCISSDGQDNPQVLTEMIAKWRQGAQIVWAIRKSRQETFKDKMAAVLFYYTLRLFANSGQSSIDLANADFYLLDRKAVDAINACQERNTSLFGLIIWIGFRQDAVAYDRRERWNGKSKWSFKSRLRLAQDWIMAFSGIPLKLMTYLGITAAVIGFLYAIFILVAAIKGYTTPGWAESVLLMLVGGGVLLIMLGIIGEYLWRTLDETRKRPLFFIERDTLNKK
jgi:polyisoprenyl-phosphate glycosyltransferase